MNTKSLNNIQEIKNKFKSLIVEKDEEEGIEHDAYMLMSGYLSEIERIQEETDLKRNALADKINISPSYLTQVFRGNKPLNFYTLAKIQRALKIKFFVKAFYKNQTSSVLSDIPIVNTNKYEFPKAGTVLQFDKGSTYILGNNNQKKVS